MCWCGRTFLTGLWWSRPTDTARLRGSGRDRKVTREEIQTLKWSEDNRTDATMLQCLIGCDTEEAIAWRHSLMEAVKLCPHAFETFSFPLGDFKWTVRLNCITVVKCTLLKGGIEGKINKEPLGLLYYCLFIVQTEKDITSNGCF